MSESVLAQLTALEKTPTADLKKMWQELMGTPPPPYNRVFLVKRLSYRVQELAFGGLSKEAEHQLDDLVDELDGKKKPKPKDMSAPIVGTRLIREWQGVLQEVTTLSDGYEWQGRAYKSLSAVARAITGTRWNGRIFFGMRKHGKLETKL